MINIKISKSKHIALDDSFFMDQIAKVKIKIQESENKLNGWTMIYDLHNIIHTLLRLEFEHHVNSVKYMKNYLGIFEYVLIKKRSIKFTCQNVSFTKMEKAVDVNCLVSFGKKLTVDDFCNGCKDCNIHKVFDVLHQQYKIYKSTSLVLACLTYSYFSHLRLASSEFMKIIKTVIILLVKCGAKKTVITDNGEIDIVDLLDDKYNNLYE